MRRVLCLAAFLLAGPTSAQEKPNPNTLTPKEIADGWVLLFDGETTFGWKLNPESKGEFKADGGTLVLNGDAGPVDVRFKPVPWWYELQGDIEVKGRVSFNPSWRGHDDKYSLEPPAGATRFRVVYAPEGDPGAKLRHVIEWTDAAGKVVGQSGMLGQGCGIMNGPALSFGVNKGSRIALRNVKLRPLDTKPLFNGKDLTGWKAFAGEKYKSKFAVTPAGEISVKDGPGDLQTDKAFGDFVLQLECKTNGKALNSGIFFRCLADQYQQGYEAQIQNAFVGDDRTKPADFGTGAIYRRIAARKVVSNDNEWFTMTVAANGKHIATWVNGYQTVDWTDDRKAEENARKGYRAGKGHISIQGHDPTTDILFRNIRIAELR